MSVKSPRPRSDKEGTECQEYRFLAYPMAMTTSGWLKETGDRDRILRAFSSTAALTVALGAAPFPLWRSRSTYPS